MNENGYSYHLQHNGNSQDIRQPEILPEPELSEATTGGRQRGINIVHHLHGNINFSKQGRQSRREEFFSGEQGLRFGEQGLRSGLSP